MVKFKCKQTGNVFSYEYEHDIAVMREQDAYEEVVEEEEVVEDKPKATRKQKGQ